MKKLVVFLFFVMIFGSCKEDDDPCKETAYQSDHACPFINAPVCGCNGKTYSSACVAEGYGIDRYTTGECLE